MATEQNYSTLRDAIDRLPQYEPEPTLWQRINNQLDNEFIFEDAVRTLPTYAPPAAVWERIETDLERPTLWSRNKIMWIGAIAATLTGLSVGGYFWTQQMPEPVEKVQVIYASVEKSEDVFKADWDNEDAEMEEIVQAFAQKATFVKQAADQSLLSEWSELNNAKSEIKTMLVKYGNDANLIRTIAEIERQRSAIVKQMATEI